MRLYKSSGTKVVAVDKDERIAVLDASSLDNEPTWNNKSRTFICSIQAYYKLEESNVVNVWIDGILVKEFPVHSNGESFASKILISELPLAVNQEVVISLDFEYLGDFNLIVPYTVTIIGE